MENDNAQLKEGLERAIKVLNKGNLTVDGIITAVDESSYTATVKLSVETLYKVPLRVLKGAKASFIEIPKVNTNCLVTFKDNNIQRPTIAEIHEAAKILITCDEVIFNGGTLGGLIKIDDLLEKINRLEDKLKDHQHAYIPYPGGSPGTPVATTKGTLATPPDTTLVFNDTTKSEIEDTKIKH